MFAPHLRSNAPGLRSQHRLARIRSKASNPQHPNVLRTASRYLTLPLIASRVSCGGSTDHKTMVLEQLRSRPRSSQKRSSSVHTHARDMPNTFKTCVQQDRFGESGRPRGRSVRHASHIRRVRHSGYLRNNRARRLAFFISCGMFSLLAASGRHGRWQGNRTFRERTPRGAGWSVCTHLKAVMAE